MTRYAEIEKALRELVKGMNARVKALNELSMAGHIAPVAEWSQKLVDKISDTARANRESLAAAKAALALPEDDSLTAKMREAGIDPDVDTLADVYMTTEQRAAFNRLCEDAIRYRMPPEDSKVVNAELYGLAFGMADNMAAILCALAQIPNSATELLSMPEVTRYLELREQSGEPMPYKVIREGDKVRFL